MAVKQDFAKQLERVLIDRATTMMAYAAAVGDSP